MAWWGWLLLGLAVTAGLLWGTALILCHCANQVSTLPWKKPR